MTTAIEALIQKFVAGDPGLFDLMAPDIDFRIDHFRDEETDISWQAGKGLKAMQVILTRLAGEVFPKGTEALSINTEALPQEGWMLTTFEQRFYYGVRGCNCTSVTLILSHESEGKVDYFRETVTKVVDLKDTA
ncbi:hypothetical protein RSK20926_02419 [Roseobacter sp. SK209-2-6]|uniref:hypothetical protein n=1 Tax=Roseobacter sp. SK209-2-6 TaxID=388739 RepID=UPI0000F3EBC7|nr:hypothetical protein [Roseobacter sp. SK209-2-6]EBA16622.1 hypothetical protein RSK20926_02419 [Roseobacter sp. SK209-2-6]